MGNIAGKILSQVGVLAVITASSIVSAQNVTITVNWNDTHQTIDGFGVGQEGNGQPGSPPYALYHWPEPYRSSIMELAFSDTVGIGLSIFRTQIPTSMESTAGTWSSVDPTQVWAMQQAVSYGGSSTKLMASVWSPPAWMKTNGATYGGTCSNTGLNCACNCDCNNNCALPSNCTTPPLPANCACQTDGGGPSYCLAGSLDVNHYQDFADYLTHYVTTYASDNGVSIYAVSVANEPDAQDVGWDSCGWSSDDLASFLNNQLSSTFSTKHITAKVIASEPGNWDYVEYQAPPWPEPSSGVGPYLSCPEASGPTASCPHAGGVHFDIAAGHTYGGNPSREFTTAREEDHKQVWQTEASLSYGVWDINGALSWATEIYDGLTSAQISAWNFFNLALWADNGSLIALDNKMFPGSYSVSKFFWVLGNFSQFIRPGFVRVGTNSSDSTVLSSAYHDPISNRVVIVLINNNVSSKIVNFSFSGYDARGMITPWITSASESLTSFPPFSYDSSWSMPQYSVVTFVLDPKGQFDALADAPGAYAVSGDFNGDGRYDIALVGGSGWTTIPVAYSNGDGTFWSTNASRADFAAAASAAGAKVAVGDVDGDGKDDLICTGASGWSTIPIALSNGDGTFTVKNKPNPSIPGWSISSSVKVLSGDVNNDGRDDIILTGGTGWTTIPVGISNGDGTFSVTNDTVSQFPTWAQDGSAQAVVTDVNGDGRADIVLTGGQVWSTTPVAMSNTTGDGGNFTVYNDTESNISTWAKARGAKTLGGCRRTVARSLTHPCDVSADHLGDIMLTGGAGWNMVPVGFSYYGTGAFYDTHDTVSSFPTWAQDGSAKAVSGDFNGDGKADIALVGGHDWFTIPVAISNGDGTFNVTNGTVP